MTSEVTGTVIGGRLELDEPLALRDNTRVTVVIRVGAEIPADWRERYIAGLEAWKKFIEEREQTVILVVDASSCAPPHPARESCGSPADWTSPGRLPSE